MASLTIGGQEYDLRLTQVDVIAAEERLLKRGGRPLLAALAARNGDVFFAGFELEALCWGAWRAQCSDERVRARVAQFYAEGGTLFELHRVIVDALIDSGVFGRRAPENGAGETATADPPEARPSA